MGEAAKRKRNEDKHEISEIEHQDANGKAKRKREEDEREKHERERQDRMARLRAELKEEDEQVEAQTDPSKQEEEEEEVDLSELSPEEQMQKLMGFGDFGSTKGQKVADNHESSAKGAANKSKARTYRQYMNRANGFNRPLDKMD